MNRRIVVCVLVAIAVLAAVAGARQQGGYDLFQQALSKERSEGKLAEAVALYDRIVREFASDRALAAKALVRMGECYEKLGATQSAEARQAYEQTITKYGDQAEAVATARARLAALGASPGGSASAVADQVVWALPVGWDVMGTVGGLSPNGRYFAFIKVGDPGLWLHDMTTASDRKLIAMEQQADIEDPVFSPDGTLVAYSWNTWDSNGAVSAELRVIGVDGSGMRVVLDAQRASSQFRGQALWSVAWTPDGKRICVIPFGRDTKTLSPALVSVADGKVQRLDHVRAEGWFEVGFSRDGRHVAYTTQRDLKTFVAAVDGSTSVPLLDGPSKSQFVGWTPDGRLLFVSDRSESNDLWSIRVADGKPVGEPERLRAGVPPIVRSQVQVQATKMPLGLASDGAFFFLTSEERTDIYLADLDPATGRVTSRPRQYNEGYAGESMVPRWSRDGDFVAYAAGTRLPNNTRPRVVIKSSTTGKERDIRLAPILSRNVWQWFPDGLSLMVDDQASGHTAWYRVDVTTGEPSLLFDAKGTVNVPAAADLTSDGRALIYSSCDTCLPTGVPGNVPPHWRLIRRDLASAMETTLFEATDEWTPYPLVQVSPDGRAVAFCSRTKDQWILRAVPGDGGTARELHRASVETTLRGWTRDGTHIMVVQPDARGATHRLMLLSVDGGDLVPAGLDVEVGTLGAGSPIGNMSVHPNGRLLAFNGRFTRRELHVIRNLVPKAALGR